MRTVSRVVGGSVGGANAGEGFGGGIARGGVGRRRGEAVRTPWVVWAGMVVGAALLGWSPGAASGVEINDRFDDRLILNGSLVFIQASNVGATAEAGEPPHHPGFSPRRSLWWEWLADRDGLVEIHTEGSTFDTILAVYLGVSLEGLTVVSSSNDDASLGTASRVVFYARAGTPYIIAVDGRNGASGNLRLTIRSPLPRNDLPGDAIAVTGDAWRDLMANHDATGEPLGPRLLPGREAGRSLWWRWTAPNDGVYKVDTAGSSFDTVMAVFEEGVPVWRVASSDDTVRDPGDPELAADTSHDVPDEKNARVRFVARAGASYLIGVDGAQGAVGAVNLTFAPVAAVAPANDRLASPSTIPTLDSTAAGTNVGASVEVEEPDHRPGDDLTAAASVWWRWVAPAGAGFTEIDTHGSAFDTVLAVYSQSTDGTLVREAWNDDDPSAPVGAGTSRAGFNWRGGREYLVAVDGVDGAQGAIQLNLTHGPQPNGLFAGALPLDGLEGFGVADSAAAGAEIGEPDHLPGVPASRSVWWVWQAPVSGTVRFRVEDAAFDTVAAVYTGDAVDALTFVASDDDSAGAGLSSVEFEAVAGATYRLVVDGKAGAGGGVVVSLSVLGSHEAWRRGYGAGFAGVDAEEYADPDGDGFTNRQEAAFGLHPLLHSRPGGQDPATANAPQPVIAGNSLHLQFRIDPAFVNLDRTLAPPGEPSSTAKVTLWGESNRDGVQWTTVDPAPVGDDVYRVSLPIDGPDALGLLRIAVQSPELPGS